MNAITRQLPPEQDRLALTRDLLALYEATRARMGEEDLAHIRHVAAYSRAIKARSRELIENGGKDGALQRGVVLHMLHVLLEFSELGHNIMHGCYDHLPDNGEFHSERWVWDFVTDPREWRVMHHQNHHPYTNIVGVDHDIGYSFLRLLPGQNWFGHHAVQPAILGTLFSFHLYHFSLYTAASAALTEGRRVLSHDTVKASLKLIGSQAWRDYIKAPLRARSRALHTLLGNYAGTVLGYDLTIAVLLFEHHAPNVQLFADPGPEETQDEYFRRQLLATTNFAPMPKLDAFFSRILEEEVDFPERPDFEIFYGGLDTHLEHHLFPDLPCQRQREIAPQVRAICEAHGLPYNIMPLSELVPDLLKSFARLALPLGEHEQAERPGRLLRSPRQLLSRVFHGLRYRAPAPTTYLKAPRFFNVPVKVLEATPLAGGSALQLRLEKPEGWDSVHWQAGAFISLRVIVNGKPLVRQYSLLRDSLDAKSLDIIVKRVDGGQVSNQINAMLRKGQGVTLVGVPQSDGDFIMQVLPRKPLFLAGGVGITPIISMIARLKREAPQTDATLIYCNHDADSVLLQRELQTLARGTGLRLHFVCSELARPQPLFRQGRLSRELLAELVPDMAEREVYVCAPPGFIAAAREHALSLGLTEDNFHTESFTPPTLLRPVVSDGRQHSIYFRRSQREVSIDGGTTLLEAARQAGIEVPSGCERGLCRACVCTKLTGVTQHEAEGGAALQRITVCNSLPRSDIELDL